jgi:hypothetical protein
VTGALLNEIFLFCIEQSTGPIFAKVEKNNKWLCLAWFRYAAKIVARGIRYRYI